MDLLKVIKGFNFHLDNDEDKAQEVLRIASVKDIQANTGLSRSSVYNLAVGKRTIDRTNVQTVKKLAGYYDNIKAALLASHEE